MRSKPAIGRAAALLCGLLVQTAWAQDAAVDAVVVSGTRTEKRAFDVPASIDRVDAEALRELQPKVNLSESLNRVPGIVVQNRHNYAQDLQLSSRGFGSRAQFGVRGVRLIADGIPAGSPDGVGQAANFSLGSAERIEVLRGPLAALYGNASGGVVQLFTAAPPGEPALGADLWAGSYGSQRLGVQLGGRAGSLGALADLSRFTTEGYRDHSAARRDHLNAKLTAPLGESHGLTAVANVLSQPDTQDPLGLTRAQFEANPRQADPAAIQFDTRKSIRHEQLGLNLDARLSGADALRATVYGGQRQVKQFLGFVGGAITSSGGVVSLDRNFCGYGLRWTRRGEAAGHPFSFVAGLESDAMDEHRLGNVNNSGVEGALRRDEDDRVKARDLFAIADWRFAERWGAVAGLRTSRVEVSFADRFIVPGNPNDSGSVDFSGTQPAAGLTYYVSPRFNVYASAGRGFETPTLVELAYRTGGTGPNFALKPSRSKQVEIGAKAFPGGDARLNVALFRIETRDEIVVDTAVGGRTTFKNAARTERDGLEVSLDAYLPADFAATLSYTFLDARFSEGFTSTGPVAAGNVLPGVPRHVAYGELRWRLPEAGFAAAFEARHSARIFVNDANLDAAPSYTVANVRAGFEQRRDGWAFSQYARIENLFDRSYIGSVIVADGNDRFFEPAARRNFLLGAAATKTF